MIIDIYYVLALSTDRIVVHEVQKRVDGTKNQRLYPPHILRHTTKFKNKIAVIPYWLKNRVNGYATTDFFVAKNTADELVKKINKQIK